MSWLRGSLLALLMAGCTPASSMALVRFADQNHCPTGRLVTRERSDLPIRLFACRSPTLEPFSWAAVRAWGSAGDLSRHCAERPPDEVARDLQRLAVWNRLEEEAWKKYDARFSAVVEVEGCGVRRFYVCHRQSRFPEHDVCDGDSLYDLGDSEPAGGR